MVRAGKIEVSGAERRVPARCPLCGRRRVVAAPLDPGASRAPELAEGESDMSA